EMSYESDDYAYVQNRRACNMYNIYGLGKTTSYTSDSSLYSSGLPLTIDTNYYVYIKLPQALESTTSSKLKEEIASKYLAGINQIAFKLLINMPKGIEPLTVYANYSDYGLCANDTSKSIIYIK